MIEYLILMGSNLGNRQELLSAAAEQLGRLSENPLRLSALYETAPWGFESEHAFLNQAALLITELEPAAMMTRLLEIERTLGRERSDAEGYTSRTIDLDILLAGDLVMDTPTLTLPHPRMHLRLFALLPAAEIAPDTIHPVFGLSLQQLLQQCPDAGAVTRLS